tara:strand:- start:12350 stop:12943 length:594 start_codon:yes stop_codon:yes gene_type:complete
MNFEHWVDNRDIRDKFYMGPLIVPYDTTNIRHRRVVGKITMNDALCTIKSILIMDLENLGRVLKSQTRFLKKREQANPELTFTTFYESDFYFLIEKLIEEGHEFQPHGEDVLTVQRLKEISHLQTCEIWEEGKPFRLGVDLNNHVSISEKIFEPIYREHKDKVGWLWDKDFLKHSKYKTLEELQEAYTNCKIKLAEL